MIPLTYALRDRVRLTDTHGIQRAVCDLPLAVLRLNADAARLLRLTAGGASVGELAATLGLDEEQVLRVCEYFRRRGLVEVELAASIDYTPRVSVIIPVKDREADIADCVSALGVLEYPRDLVEVIVVDDGSADGTAAVAGRLPCRVIVNERTMGQSYCRNLAASLASGEILAFIDSDCVADPGWLGELVPYLAWPRVAAVGGLVESFFSSSILDRYEQTASSLNLGRRLRISLDDADTFYAPTCNLLVRRGPYLAAGGFREDLHLGEDVDLCWRLRARGGYMVYAPHGVVCHKHRDHLGAFLKRRAQYGTSESVLYEVHREKLKLFPLPALPAFSFAALIAALLLRNARLMPLVLLPCVLDTVRRMHHLWREGVAISPGRVGFSVLRGHLSLVYYLLFHLVRYYLLLLVAAGCVVPPLWVVAAFSLLYTSVVDYTVQHPRLDFPAFLACRVLEHGAYQVGVGLGCLRRRTLRPYRLSFRKAPAFVAG